MSYSFEGMLDVRQLGARQETHEDLFLQLYDELLSWAMYLTDRRRERAEDLVHDSFIQFTRTRPDLSSIKDIRSYLFRVIRNMHLSHLRRWLQSSYAPLSISDFDSAEAGLRTIAVETDHAARQLEDVKLRVLADLRHVCHYACARKELSKAGSVLILRFFHGYYPSEISRIMRTTRKAVEEWLRIARREVKVHQSDPLRLRFMSWNPKLDVPSLGPKLSADEIVEELRQAVFRTQHGDCVEREQLQRIYSAENDVPVECATLAHIVSCEPCLDKVNGVLGIDPLSARCPIDKLGRDKSSSSTLGPPRVEEFKRKAAKSVRAHDEHRPLELRIVVNGYVLASQRVAYEQSEQIVTVNLNEPISFVEVFSEQDIRLMYFEVHSTTPGSDQQERIQLTGGRALEAVMSFGDVWPILRVSYCDPSLGSAIAPDLDREIQRKVRAREPACVRKLSEPVFKLACYELPDIKGPWAWSQFFRPARLTAVIAIILIAALLWSNRPVPSVLAAALLKQAVEAEQVLSSNPNEAINQVVTLEERNAEDGRLLSTRRIDTWRRGDGTTARRLYDQNHKPIAGEWKESTGSRRVYHRGVSVHQQAISQKFEDLLSTGDLWRLDLSAAGFESVILAVNVNRAKVKETASSYVVSYEPPASAGSDTTSQLVRATLTLNRSDLHATEQTLVVKSMNRVSEYRFIEASYQRHGIESVPKLVFDPDPELAGSAAHEPVSDQEARMVMPTPAMSDLELAALEVEARYLLDQVGANLGEQVTFARTADGRLRIEALVDTDNRKAELVRALEPIERNPAVAIDVSTIAEASKRHGQPTTSEPSVITRFEGGRSEMPAYEDLRRHFTEKLGRGASDAEVEREIQRFAAMMQIRAEEPMKQAWALKRLVENFTPAQLKAMDPKSFERWRRMIAIHSGAVQVETEKLRHALEKVFVDGVRVTEEQYSGDLQDVEEVMRVVERLFELVSTSERIVSRAFSHSVGNGAAVSIRGEQLWRSLRRAEALAKRLAVIAR